MEVTHVTLPGGYRPRITQAMLEDMEPGPFATGTTNDDHTGVNMTGSGKLLRWVAVRGQASDWAIYIYWATHSADYIKDSGDKIYNEENVKKLIDADKKAMAGYRF